MRTAFLWAAAAEDAAANTQTRKLRDPHCERRITGGTSTTSSSSFLHAPASLSQVLRRVKIARTHRLVEASSCAQRGSTGRLHPRHRMQFLRALLS